MPVPSFDVVSKADPQEILNAVTQAQKEILTRYDFKNIKASIEWNAKDNKITLLTEGDKKLEALKDILMSKLVKRGVSLKNLKTGTAQPATNQQLRQEITVEQGIGKEHSKKIIDLVKNSKLKVQAQIMDDLVRVSGKKLDDLQAVMGMLRSATNIELGLQFQNMRD